MKALAAAVLLLAATAVRAAEPDGLILPPGFHAQVIASGLTGARHLAIRDNGDIYISTRGGATMPTGGIIALHLDADHRLVRTERFSDVSNGSGIRFDHGALYASSPTAVYKFRFRRNALVPFGAPDTVLSGFPPTGFLNRMLAFDGKGDLFVSIGSSGNICTAPAADPHAPPVGKMPCPDLIDRAGIWRFAAARIDQHFPQDGTRIATGIRDMDALDWRQGDALYAAMQGRNGTAATWPDTISERDDDAVAEEMHRITPGTNFGWPYTYYDGARRLRLTAPEYGGDGRTPPERGKYSDPLVAFPGHSAPIDLAFYRGRNFPRAYRGGAFIAFHGSSAPATARGHPGFDIAFVPFDRHGRPGAWTVFADGFAGADAASRNASTAAYRPTGLAVGPDGALYVADSVKGRIWRITYGAKTGRL